MSKFRIILQALRKEIAEGKYAAQRRLPTESQLVARFEVSRPTVTRALDEMEAEGIVERRAGSGTYLKRGAPLDAGRLGMIVPALGNTEIFDPICAEIVREASEEQYTVLSNGSWPDNPADRARLAEDLCRQYIQKQVSGVFFAPVELIPEDEALNLRVVAALDEAGIPLVLLDRDTHRFPHRSQFDLVGIDNFTAGFDLARHLIGLGCHRIVFVARPFSAPTVDLRIAGWREAMVRARLESGSKRVCLGDAGNDAFVQDVLRQTRPEAIICANDMTAATVMQSLARLGVRVPEDIRLVGFDDLKYARLLSVPLTTMQQPCRAIGEVAVEAMRERIRNPKMAAREILLKATLVVRDSCGSKLPKSGAGARPVAAAKS